MTTKQKRQLVYNAMMQAKRVFLTDEGQSYVYQQTKHKAGLYDTLRLSAAYIYYADCEGLYLLHFRNEENKFIARIEGVEIQHIKTP